MIFNPGSNPSPSHYVILVIKYCCAKERMIDETLYCPGETDNDLFFCRYFIRKLSVRFFRKIIKIIFELYFMFTEILKEEKLEEISKTYKKGGCYSAVTEIYVIVIKLCLKNNTFANELVIDKTIINIFKIKKLRERAQEGRFQLAKFSNWLLKEFRSEKELIVFDSKIVELLNHFEEYIIRLKERETALLEIIASWGSIFLAIIAITISIVAININL